MLIERILKPALGFGANPEGLQLEQRLKDGSLSHEQLVIILENTGQDLAKIHAREGRGFGWIDPLRAIITRKFVGQYNTWYEFLLAFYDQHTLTLDRIFETEKSTGEFHAPMSKENRYKLMELHSQRPAVREILKRRKTLLTKVSPKILHGNVYIGSIFVKKDGKYAGLGDFTQMLVGDPVDDLAYSSIMPRGGEFLPNLEQGWQSVTTEMDIEEKIHLYRLWQAYRKTYTRYAKHRYLNEYPEPLRIAQEEINHFK